MKSYKQTGGLATVLQIIGFFAGVFLSAVFGVVMFSEDSEHIQKLLGTNGAPNAKSETLRILGLWISGAIALYALGSYDKRTNAQVKTASTQAEAATAQAEAAAAQARSASAQADANKLEEEVIIQGRLQAAVTHLTDASQSGRIAAFYEFYHLAQAKEDYAQSIVDILCAHLQEITKKPGGAKSQETRALVGGLLFRIDMMDVFEEQLHNLEGVNLAEFDFSNLYFPPDIILQSAHLEEANLRNAILRNANLRGAHFDGAKLENADLRDADLEGAILTGANLEKADFRGANLEGAKLGGVGFLQTATLRGAKYNGDTEFPDGVLPEQMGMVKAEI